MTKKKKIIGALLSVLLIIVGFAVILFTRFFIRSELYPETVDEGLLVKLLLIMCVILYLIISAFAIIIHESGHLIFGLMTGYKFVSFRIFGRMLMRDSETGKLKTVRHGVLGTAGQCLMSPPEADDNYRFHYVLYNYGGVIMNFLSAVCVILLLVLVPMYFILAWILYLFVIVSVYMGVINLVMFGKIANDGYNGLIIAGSEDARRVIWEQLKINALLTSGIRLKDMPEEYFGLPPVELRRGGDSFMSAKGIFRVCYLMDRGDFEEAKHLIDYLLENEKNMHKAHLVSMKMERIYLELLIGNDGSLIDRLYDTQLKNIVKAGKHSLSCCRFNYTYNLLYTMDMQNAASEAERFAKLKSKAPSRADAENEDMLMSRAYELYKKRTMIL